MLACAHHFQRGNFVQDKPADAYRNYCCVSPSCRRHRPGMAPDLPSDHLVLPRRSMMLPRSALQLKTLQHGLVQSSSTVWPTAARMRWLQPATAELSSCP